jgi:hypothetical protein
MQISLLKLFHQSTCLLMTIVDCIDRSTLTEGFTIFHFRQARQILNISRSFWLGTRLIWMVETKEWLVSWTCKLSDTNLKCSAIASWPSHRFLRRKQGNGVRPRAISRILKPLQKRTTMLTLLFYASPSSLWRMSMTKTCK